MQIYEFSFSSKFSKWSFFWPWHANLFLDFNLYKTYRNFSDLAHLIEYDLLYPEIIFSSNLNGWSKVKNSIFWRNFTNMSPAFQMNISLTPYYSSSWGWDILLYESLQIENILKINVFSVKLLKKMMKNWKNQIFQFFSILSLFLQNLAKLFSHFYPSYNE